MLFEKTSSWGFKLVKFQRYLRSRRNKSEFDTISGEELQRRGEDGFWSIQLGRSPNWTGPARRTTELNLWLIQLGRSDELTIRPLVFFFCFSTSFYFDRREDLLGKFSDVDFVVTDFDPNNQFIHSLCQNACLKQALTFLKLL